MNSDAPCTFQAVFVDDENLPKFAGDQSFFTFEAGSDFGTLTSDGQQRTQSLTLQDGETAFLAIKRFADGLPLVDEALILSFSISRTPLNSLMTTSCKQTSMRIKPR